MLTGRSSGEEIEARMRREFGRRIVQMRIERNLAQVDLARKLRIDRSRLGKWERGLHSPSFAQLVDLARELDITLDELLTGRKPVMRVEKKIDREALSSLLAALNGLL